MIVTGARIKMEYFLLFIIGISLGSFLNVLIDRLSTDRPFIKGRSYCENCKKTLEPVDLIPLLSYLILKGRCRHCKKMIPIHLFLVELLIGILTIFVYQFSIMTGQSAIATVSLFVILYTYIGIFVADILYGIIPDLMLLVSIISSAIFIQNQNLPYVTHLLSAICASAFFLFLFLVTRGRGMGFGDVKLSFGMGLLLGFPNIVVALYIAFLTGAFISIILVLWKKLRFLGGTIPFGPFLVGGTIIAFFYGSEISSWIIQNYL